jgi:hypothetical protein
MESKMIETVMKKKRNQESNRLTLTLKVQEKAKDWLSQINNQFNGMLSLKRNDLLNFLLEEMDAHLSQTLMDRIKDQKLTDKEKAKWIYQKFLDAEKKGLELDFNDLVKTAQGNSKKTKKPRKAKNTSSQTLLNIDSQKQAHGIKKANNIN